MIQKQYAAVDILKFICALLVVCIHTAPLLDISVEANFFVVQIVSRLAVPFFFIMSGFFVFLHIDCSKKWNDPDNLSYMKKYILRILTLYSIWTIIYFPLTLHDGMQSGFSIMYWLRYIRDFFLNGSYYHLWYLPGLIFASAFVYFLLLTLGKKKTFLTVAVLYIMGSLYNIFSIGFLDNPMIALYDTLFSTSRNGLFFGSVFVFLGFVLANEDSMDKKTSLLAGVISFIAMISEVYILKSFGFMHPLTSMYLFLVPTVFFMFQYVLRLPLSPQPVYKTLRSMSSLIYVSHILFVTTWNLIVPDWNALLIYVMVVLSCCVFACIVLQASKRYPILKALY